MNITDLIAGARASIAKRQRYNSLAAEIRNLTHRELVDLRADRGDMLRDLRREFYG